MHYKPNDIQNTHGPKKEHIFCPFSIDLLTLRFNWCKNVFFTYIENTECEDVLMQGKEFAMFQLKYINVNMHCFGD